MADGRGRFGAPSVSSAEMRSEFSASSAGASARVLGSTDGERVATGVLPASTVSPWDGDDAACVGGAATTRGELCGGPSSMTDSMAATDSARAVSTVTTSTGCARITTARPFDSPASHKASARGGWTLSRGSESTRGRASARGLQEDERSFLGTRVARFSSRAAATRAGSATNGALRANQV